MCYTNSNHEIYLKCFNSDVIEKIIDIYHLSDNYLGGKYV